MPSCRTAREKYGSEPPKTAYLYLTRKPKNSKISLRKITCFQDRSTPLRKRSQEPFSLELLTELICMNLKPTRSHCLQPPKVYCIIMYNRFMPIVKKEFGFLLMAPCRIIEKTESLLT